MNNKVNYTAVGAYVVLFGFSLIFIVLWLTSAGDHKSYRFYMAYMNESVSGLAEGSPVKFNGVNVGEVKRITLNPVKPKEVQLLLKIQESILVRKDTVATLKSQGLTGMTFVGLSGGSMHAPLVHRERGRKYPVIKTKPSLLVQLDATVRRFSENVDVVTKNIRRLLNDKNQKSVSQTLQNLQKVSDVFAKSSHDLTATFRNFKTITDNTAKASRNFPAISAQAHQTMNDLRDASSEIKQAMRSTRSTLDSMNDQLLPETVNTLRELNRLSLSLRRMSNDLQANPGILVHGKQDDPLGPGEK